MGAVGPIGIGVTLGQGAAFLSCAPAGAHQRRERGVGTERFPSPAAQGLPVQLKPPRADAFNSCSRRLKPQPSLLSLRCVPIMSGSGQISRGTSQWLCALPFLRGILAAKLFLKGSLSWDTVLLDGKIKFTGQY